MKQVAILGQQFPVPEDTDAANMPTWATLYTDALKAAFAASPSSAFPVPTAVNNDQVLITVGGLPKWTTAPYVKKTGDTMTGPLTVPKVSVQITGVNGFDITAWADATASTVFTNWSGTGTQQVAVLQRDGTWTGMKGSWAPSSRRIKTDIEDLDASAFDGIQPVAFTYNDDAPESFRGDRRFGFIAEEVAEAGVPVLRDAEGLPQALNDTDLVAVLWAKVQQLQTRIEELEAR